MQKYVNQLLGDIREAHRKEIDPPESYPQTIEEELEEIERYLEGEEESYPPFSEHCGLKKEQFPPAHRLTKKQLKSICKAFDKMLFSWNMYATLPKDLPIDRTYDILTTLLDRRIGVINSGMLGLEFCDYEVETCIFDEYCSCREVNEEMKEKELEMDRYIRQLLRDLAKGLDNLPDARTFQLIYGVQQHPDKPVGPVKKLVEWLGFSSESFPESFLLNHDQMDAVSEAILAFWSEGEDLHFWLAQLDAAKRYERLVEFLEAEAWYDGQGGFRLVPVPDEEMKRLRSPLDELDLGSLLDFDKEEEENDDDIPF